MAGYMIILNGQSQFDHALATLNKMPRGGAVTFQEDVRSQAQNRKMWPLLQDIVKRQIVGREHQTKEIWKSVFMHQLGYETEYLVGLNGEIFSDGLRSSHLKKEEFSDLITNIIKYGDENGVLWTHPIDVQQMLRDLPD